jgi:replication fork clamp-binding protein CrfC
MLDKVFKKKKKKKNYIKETSKKFFVIFADSFDPKFDIRKNSISGKATSHFQMNETFFNLLISFSLKISKNKIKRTKSIKNQTLNFTSSII